MDNRKKRLSRRQILPFKECSIRFGELAVLTHDAEALLFDITDDQAFRRSGLTFNAGDILIPIEITNLRGVFAIKCLTKHGLMHVNTRVLVKAP